MNDSPLRVVPPPRTEPERAPDHLHEQRTEAERAADLAEVRRILVGPEAELLRNLLERLNNPRVRARELSRVLPEAITRGNQENEEALTKAITPNFAQAFTATIKKNPRPVAEAITPLMGPAIRRAIALALSGFIQTLDFSVKHSLSWQGLKWRLEAWRTGQDFGQLVLTRMAIFRVEHVFLIHKEKGLLLLHVAAPGFEAQETGVVSAMMTGLEDALRSFGQDSFGKDEGTIDKLDLGDREVWLEPGPYAVLAAVVYKQAPESFRTDYLTPAIEAIHIEQGEALSNFDGDATPFEAARPYLESCLQSQYQGQLAESTATTGFKAPFYLKAIATCALLALLGVSVWAWRSQRHWDQYISQLKATPGLVVMAEGRRGWGRFVEGLRDPLADDPARIMREQSAVDPRRVELRWEPYQALVPKFVLARAQRLLAPPAGVTLQFADGHLAATGPATNRWIAEARRLAPALGGVEAFDERGLVNEDLRAAEALRQRIEAHAFRFVAGSTRLVVGQETALQELVADLQKLTPLATRMERAPQVEIIGHTDTEGDEANNQRLSDDRARTMLARMIKARLSAELFMLRGAASKEPLRPEASVADKELNRRVSFKLVWKN